MRLALPFVALAGACSAPAQAQPSGEAPESRDFYQVGVGVTVNSDYDGSDDYRLIPGGIFRARISNIDVTAEGLGLSADLVSTGRRLDFDLGPVVQLNLNRTGGIRDDVVDRLPDRDAAVEVGGLVGVTARQLTNPFDSLSLRVKVTHDVAGAHGGTIVSPSVTFGTPLSRQTFVGASLSTDFVTNRYADYYYSITPADSLRSGLRTFDADGGMKDWSVGLLFGQSLSGDLRRGWSIFGIASRSQLLGDFKRSPIVADRGSATQWFGAIGIGYGW